MALSATVTQEQGVGVLLRRWRHARGKSQLDLALSSQVSQRHVSFIESGRSVPSRAMLLNLTEALDVPFRERNALFLAAGYAPIYPDGGWDEPEMRSINVAIDRLLRQQEPYPAIVMDRYWNVIATNQAAPTLFGRFIDLETLPKPRNLLRLIFDPAGLRPYIANWEELAAALIGRLQRETTGRVMDGQTSLLLHELMRFPDVKPEWQHEVTARDLPMIPLSLVHEGRIASYFSMVCVVGTPQSIVAQEFRLECMFPADAESEATHAILMAEA